MTEHPAHPAHPTHPRPIQSPLSPPLPQGPTTTTTPAGAATATAALHFPQHHPPVLHHPFPSPFGMSEVVEDWWPSDGIGLSAHPVQCGVPCILPVPQPILHPIGDHNLYPGLYHNPSPVALSTRLQPVAGPSSSTPTSFPTAPVTAIVPSQSEPRRVPATLEDSRQSSLPWPLDYHSGHSSHGNWSHPISSLPVDPTPIHHVGSTIEGIPSWSVNPRDTPARHVDSLREFPPTASASAPYNTPTVVPHHDPSAIPPTPFAASYRQWTSPNQAFPTLLSTEPVPTISYPCSPLLPPLLSMLFDPSPLTLPSPAPAPVPGSIIDLTASCHPRGSGAGTVAPHPDADADTDTNIMGGMPVTGINSPCPPLFSLPSGILGSNIVRPTASHQDAGVSLIGSHLSAPVPFVVERKDMDHEVSMPVPQDMPHTSEGYIPLRQKSGPPPIPSRASIVPSQAPFTAQGTAPTPNPSGDLDIHTIFSFHPPPFKAIAIATPFPAPAHDPYSYPHSHFHTPSLLTGPKPPIQTTSKSKPRRPTRPKRGTLPLFRLARQHGSLTLPSPFAPRPNSSSNSNSNSDSRGGTGLTTSTATSQGERPPSLAEQIESMTRGSRRARKTTPPRVEGWVPPDQRPLPPKQPTANGMPGTYGSSASSISDAAVAGVPSGETGNILSSSSAITFDQAVNGSRTPTQNLSGPLRPTLLDSPLPEVTVAATTTQTATLSPVQETPARPSKKRVGFDLPPSPPAVGSSSAALTATSTISDQPPPYNHAGTRPSLVVPSQAPAPPSTTGPMALRIPSLSAFIGSSSPVKLAPHDQQAVSYPRPDSASQKKIKCTDCDTLFTRSNDMVRHHRSQHTGYRPYPCTVCGAAFARSDKLLNHRLKSETCHKVWTALEGRKRKRSGETSKGDGAPNPEKVIEPV